MGVDISYPFVVFCDSKQAISFQGDTCPRSKIRGSFDLREDWVSEVRDQKTVQMCKVEGTRNLADLFTKCLPTYKFKALVKMINEFQDQIF